MARPRQPFVKPALVAAATPESWSALTRHKWSADQLPGAGLAGPIQKSFADPSKDRNPDPSVCRSWTAGTRKLTQAHPLWWDRTMYLATTPKANRLLENSPLALLIAMLLDQHSAARTED